MSAPDHALSDLIRAAKAVLPIFTAVQHSVGLGKNQLSRIEALRAAIAEAERVA